MIRELKFQFFCKRYSDEIYRYARAILGQDADAEDASQEILVKLWHHLPEIPILKVRPWIFRTTRNYCLDQVRKNRRQTQPVYLEGESLEEYADESVLEPGQSVDSELLRHQIDAALEQVPDPLKSVFILYEVNGLRYQEIALTLDIPVNSVKVYLLRARKKLQRLLSHHELWIKSSKN